MHKRLYEVSGFFDFCTVIFVLWASAIIVCHDGVILVNSINGWSGIDTDPDDESRYVVLAILIWHSANENFCVLIILRIT